MKVLAVCEQCAMRHRIDFDPLVPTLAFADWQLKHSSHDSVKFLFPTRHLKWSIKDRLKAIWQWRRRASGGLVADLRQGVDDVLVLPSAYAAFLPNADIKTAYGASTAVTITLASLAASSTLLGGRESTAIDNGASNKYGDYHLAGNYRTAATNLQAGIIRTAVVGARDDTPSWPDVFDGTDSAETVTTASIYNAICRSASDLETDATQRTWPFGPVSVKSLFGQVPDQFVIFVSHTAQITTNAWSSTEGDHAVRATGIYETVI
jgi:hypothetical protein